MKKRGIKVKKEHFISIFSVVVLSLSGCSQVEHYLTDKIWEKSGISVNEDYQEYQSLAEEGQLDSSGMYEGLKESNEEFIEPPGPIHVTFAENSFLEFTYYWDFELTSPIDIKNCYLNPGESFYASIPKVNNPNTTQYNFSKFRVWACDEKNQWRTELDIKEETSNLVVTIPEDCPWTQLVVEPLGEYEDRILSLKDCYIDNNGEEIELNGIWSINDDSIITGKTAMISPLMPYTIFYDYSDYLDEYYLEDSEPKAFAHNEKNGIVEFYTISPQKETQNYTVYLHRYIKLKITNQEANFINNAILAVTKNNDIIKSISVNGNPQSVSGKKEQIISQLKCGDKLLIRVGNDYTVTASGLDIETVEAAVKDGYEYAFTIPQTIESELDIVVTKR